MQMSSSFGRSTRPQLAPSGASAHRNDLRPALFLLEDVCMRRRRAALLGHSRCYGRVELHHISLFVSTVSDHPGLAPLVPAVGSAHEQQSAALDTRALPFTGPRTLMRLLIVVKHEKGSPRIKRAAVQITNGRCRIPATNPGDALHPSRLRSQLPSSHKSLTWLPGWLTGVLLQLAAASRPLALPRWPQQQRRTR